MPKTPQAGRKAISGPNVKCIQDVYCDTVLSNLSSFTFSSTSMYPRKITIKPVSNPCITTMITKQGTHH